MTGDFLDSARPADHSADSSHRTAALPPAFAQVPPAERQRRPKWWQPRLIVGVLLIAVSVFAGARIVAAADETTTRWAVRAPVAAGTTLAARDVAAVRVRLLTVDDRYLASRPVGKTVTRDLGAGELIPAGAVRARPCGSLLTLPVAANRVPPSLLSGQRIDLFSTATQGDSTQPVLQGAVVQDVGKPGSGMLSAGATWSITVRVPATSAPQVVAAVRGGELDVVVTTDAQKDKKDGDLCADADAESATNGQPS